MPKFFRPVSLQYPCITILLLFATLSSHAQSINLKINDKPISEVIKSIERQTGYTAFYDATVLDKSKSITITAENLSLKGTLDRLFSNTPYSYEIIARTIVIKEKTRPANQEKAKLNPIDGRVLDEQGQPLIGATVKIKGSNKTTTTNLDGAFSFSDVGNSDILQITYVGYQIQEVKATNNVVVKLKMAAGDLNEVAIVSTGYQTIPKERATGSFVQIDNELLNRRVSTNLLDRLDGVTSGLIFNKSTGSNGLLPSNEKLGISIRGRSTIDNNVSADPLIVLDNFPYEGDIGNLNPNDIESITILKDAAAASIWGARSGNGVIVITTKKGKINQPLKIELNSNVTFENKPDLCYTRNYLSSSSYVDIENYLFGRGFYDANLANTTTYPAISQAVQILSQLKTDPTNAVLTAQLNGLRAVDVRKQTDQYFYQNGLKQQYALNFSGGSDKVVYGFNVAYDSNRGTAINSNYKRISFNSINTYRPFKNLELTAGIIYNGTDENVGNGYSSAQPYNRLADENGNALSVPFGYNQSYLASTQTLGFKDWQYRPIDERNFVKNTREVDDLILRGQVRYHFTSYLSTDLQYQIEKQTGEAVNARSVDSYFVRDLINKYAQRSNTGIFTYPFPIGGTNNISDTEINSKNFRWQLNYNQTLSSKHSISAIAGTEIRQIITQGSTHSLLGYDDDLGIAVNNLNYNIAYPVNPSGYGSLLLPSPDNGVQPTEITTRYISYYANAAYTYLDRYTFSASGRKDGANIFGVNTNDKITPLWSAGIGWNISKEAFYNFPIIPYLKLRATYGYNGNVYNASAYLTASYGTSNLTGLQQATITNPPNPELRWEKIRNTNLGLDFSSKGNVISGSVELYEKLGKDLIQNTILAPSSGFSSFKGNSASIKTRGVDLIINTKNLNGTFKWSTTFLFNYQKDKVIYFDTKYENGYLALANNLQVNGGIYPVVGNSLFGLYSYRWSGLDPVTGDPIGVLNGQQTKDYIAIINSKNADDVVYHGSSRPMHFGSIRNTFAYRGLSISANITYKFNYFFRKFSTNLNYTEILNNPNADYENRWQKAGDEELTSVPSLVYVSNANRNNFYQGSEILVEKGDHIRFQDISIGYELNKNTWKQLPFSNIQFYAYVNNLGILWSANKSGIDPDFNQNLFSSYTTNFPASRTYSLGIRANLK
ncbi:SusC/RagA family TonB-linked outer membrane protein [Pedobacter agri]|uniref:SusC/RagA family TonB-linked outer membrane protein n=1 Tax=Pedobacter agri TaxID=454586 RepID=UPI0029304B3F|nr:SusC/RagA family TonB-linked outer membrane protein [Pedobacter agri]